MLDLPAPVVAMLLLWPWRVSPCGARPSAVVVGWSPSVLAHVLWHVLPLVVSCEPSVGVVLVVAIIITTIVIVPIIVVVATVVVVPAIVIIAMIVAFASVVIIVIVVILPIAVVVPIPVAGPWLVAVPGGWSAASLGLGCLQLNLLDGRGIFVE